MNELKKELEVRRAAMDTQSYRLSRKEMNGIRKLENSNKQGIH